MLSNANFQKMRIEAHDDVSFQSRVDELTVMLNPENYSRQYQVNYHRDQSAGNDGSELIFESITPQTLSFDFLFDRTGAIPIFGTPHDEGIHGDIEHFRELTMGYDGNIHRTRYLILNWGRLNFRCCLTNMNVAYKLFRPDGIPLRAKVKATFKEFKEATKRVQEQDDKSPDLTHMYVVKEGDTLPLLAHKVYGDASRYLEVAQANNLINFRKLVAGDKIFFPPLEK